MTSYSKLAACLLNISEAKNIYLVEKIAKAGIVKAFSKENQDEYLKIYGQDKKLRQQHPELSPLCNQGGDVELEQLRVELFGDKCYTCQTSILNIFADPIYNRSVITITGTLPGVEKGVTAACLQAFQSLEGKF